MGAEQGSETVPLGQKQLEIQRQFCLPMWSALTPLSLESDTGQGVGLRAG